MNGLDNYGNRIGNGYLDALALVAQGCTCIPAQGLSYLDAKAVSMIQSYKQRTANPCSLKNR